MIRQKLVEFIKRFGSQVKLAKDNLIRQNEKLFFVKEELKPYVTKSFYYAGIYLGKIQDNQFLPSFSLLRILASKKANRVIVNKKTEWLVTCGRDIFHQGIIKVKGSNQKNDYTLILNEALECLGFGRILADLDQPDQNLMIKTMLDIGDFLHRER